MSDNEFSLKSPFGEPITIPIEVDHGNDLFSDLETPASRRDYFDNQGFVVIRGLVPSGTCSGIVAEFRRNAKAPGKKMVRFPSYEVQENKYGPGGFVSNSTAVLRNAGRGIDGLIEASTIGASEQGLLDEVENLMGASPMLTEIIHYEGNNGQKGRGTTIHQDVRYIPRSDPAAVSAWVALEDIHPGAGRLFIYPGSHKYGFDYEKGSRHNDPTRDEMKYLVEMRRLLLDKGDKPIAPAVEEGDVIFLKEGVMHGGLEATEAKSRNAQTWLYFPSSAPYSGPSTIVGNLKVVPGFSNIN